MTHLGHDLNDPRPPALPSFIAGDGDWLASYISSTSTTTRAASAALLRPPERGIGGGLTFADHRPARPPRQGV